MARILIADDSKVVRLMLRTALSRTGHEVVEAADGEAAVRIAEEERPDAAITDLNMPEMNGLEVIEKLRAMPGFADRPILVLTTADRTRCREEARRRGATGWIDKPFDEASLLSALGRLLEKGS